MNLPALYGISIAHLVEITGCTDRTARRYKRLQVLPPWLARLVAICLEGELGEISRAWRGWRLAHGELISPEGWRFNPGQIHALPFLRQQLQAAQVRGRLPGQADWISGEFEPVPECLVADAWPRPSAQILEFPGGHFVREAARDSAPAGRVQQ